MIFTPEDEKFLVELADKMNSQDNACTSTPLYFIYEKLERPDENGDIVKWVDDDWAETTPEEVCEYDGKKLEGMAEDEIEEMMKDARCTEQRFILENHSTGIFFITREAALEHIKERGYRYTNPHVYVHSGYWSWEVERLLGIISKLGAKPNTGSYPGK